MDYKSKFRNGLKYSAFLDRYATIEQKQRWSGIHELVELTAAQSEILTGFVREMRVLVLAGAWCGDCVNQCPIFDHFSSVTSTLNIRYFDRDDNPDLAEALSICGGQRVPSIAFLSEDNLFCGRYGDQTLAKYRDMAATHLGAACPSGIVVGDTLLLKQVTQEWLNEFERIQLMLRLSPRLRRTHGD